MRITKYSVLVVLVVWPERGLFSRHEDNKYILLTLR